MDIYAHQTHHVVANFDDIFSYLETNFTEKTPKGLHLFPELFLCGYPLRDLCLQKNFIGAYQTFLRRIDTWSLAKPKDNETALLLGGLRYEFEENGLARKIENVIYLLRPGHALEYLYTKKLLPNYDIFDEKKYFVPGDKTVVWNFNDKNIALTICEDMWASHIHKEDPILDIKTFCEKGNIKLDLIINLSASPFNIGKEIRRIQRASEISHMLKTPFVYVNRVGGEDEILFDGASFLISGDELENRGKLFAEDLLHFSNPTYNQEKKIDFPKEIVLDNTWESLFRPSIEMTQRPAILTPLTDEDCENLLEALKFGIREYAEKCGFKNFLVALSGGIDSALVLTIVRLALKEGEGLEAIYMPGFFSATMSYDLSADLCKNLGIKLRNLPIKFFHSAIRNAYKDNFGKPMEGLTDENIQSRLRGTLLYTRANDLNAMVLNTSNKSELAVGYSTQYGDSVGALSVLGDLYKTEVFALSRYINKKFPGLITEGIITRPPTAELRENQLDSQSLPPYERLDPILEGLLSYRMSVSEIVALGFAQEEVEKVHRLWRTTEYKRYQFAPIIKVKSKSFGFGYRVPICKKANIS